MCVVFQIAIVTPTDDQLAAARTTLMALPSATAAQVDAYFLDFGNSVLALQKKFPDRVLSFPSSAAAADIAAVVL